MKKFIQRVIVFVIIGLALGEVVARLFVLSSDIPRRQIDEFGIQKYIPNQTGNWVGGEHGWQVNEKGWVGDLPNDFSHLITIVGDSYIENFMNPDECRQRVYLKKELPDYNFMEAARSGVTFIEAIEIAEHLEKYKPEYQFIYVSEGDLKESILQLGKKPDITQVDLEKEKIIPGQIKASRLKRILYNWKFIYYLYRRFPLNIKKTTLDTAVKIQEVTSAKDDFESYKALLKYAKKEYDILNKVLVFGPDTDVKLRALAREIGFTTILLINKDDKTWSFEHDSHWSCYGHQQAASQVAQFLRE